MIRGFELRIDFFSVNMEVWWRTLLRSETWRDFTIMLVAVKRAREYNRQSGIDRSFLFLFETKQQFMG